MKLYIESNFILEIAFKQSQHHSCESILYLAEQGGISLLLPSLALVEPFSTVYRQRRSRNETREKLELIFSEVNGADLPPFRKLAEQIPDWQKDLSAASDEAIESLNEAFMKVCKVAEIIEMSPQIMEIEKRHKENSPLKENPIDNLMFSFIIWHREINSESEAVFVSKDKGFKLIERSGYFSKLIQNLGLKILYSFDKSLQYLKKPHSDS